MMLRSLSTAVLAISLAIPALAQQKDAASLEVRKQVEAVTMKWMEAVNKGDAKGAAALAAVNPINVTPYGLITSREKIEEETQNVHGMGLNITLKIAEVQSLLDGRGAIVAGGYTGTYTANPTTPQVQGNFLQVMERDGNEWKIRVAAFSRSAPPSPGVATGATGTQPSTGSSTPPATGTTTQQNPAGGVSK